jgi:hypothetical protein
MIGRTSQNQILRSIRGVGGGVRKRLFFGLARRCRQVFLPQPQVIPQRSSTGHAPHIMLIPILLPPGHYSRERSSADESFADLKS